MAFSLKPRLSGENSIIVSLAAAATVFAVYNMKVGPVSDVHATNANDINMRASVKKAGWESVVLVGALFLLANDLNIAIMGGGAIVFEELSYRHALMASPANGQIEVTPSSYLPAGSQGQSQPPNLQLYTGGSSGVVEAVAG